MPLQMDYLTPRSLDTARRSTLCSSARLGALWKIKTTAPEYRRRRWAPRAQRLSLPAMFRSSLLANGYWLVVWVCRTVATHPIFNTTNIGRSPEYRAQPFRGPAG